MTVMKFPWTVTAFIKSEQHVKDGDNDLSFSANDEDCEDNEGDDIEETLE